MPVSFKTQILLVQAKKVLAVSSLNDRTLVWYGFIKLIDYKTLC